MPFELKIPEREYGGYIFDLDGTLADSMNYHFTAWTDAVRAQGFDIDWSRELFNTMAGMNVRETVDRINRHFGISLDARRTAREKIRRYEELAPNLKPVPPVYRFAKEVYEKNLARAVGTGAPRLDALATLDAIDAHDWFDVVVTQEDVKNGKPDPETFLVAAEKMGVDPKTCLVLEDSELGIRAAKAAGMEVIRIPIDWDRE